MARKKGTFEKISSKARRLGQQMKKGEIKVVPGVKINGLPVVNYQAADPRSPAGLSSLHTFIGLPKKVKSNKFGNTRIANFVYDKNFGPSADILNDITGYNVSKFDYKKIEKALWTKNGKQRSFKRGSTGSRGG